MFVTISGIFAVSLLVVMFVLIGSYVLCPTRFAIGKNKEVMDTIVRTLYRQSARWAVASDQDDNEVIRLLHANYATGYLWAIKDIASSEDFKRATGEDFLQFEQKIVGIQDRATRILAERCKAVIPIQDPSLLKAMYIKG